MHYYIDGYNMLFRLMRYEGNLQTSREQIIRELNDKITIANLDVSIVFDAAFQIGERRRTHFNALEILFTAQGETADEFILDELKNALNPHQETVVTSDKKLAHLIRRCSGHTQSIEEFLFWLNRVYKNRLKQQRKSENKSLNRPSIPQLKSVEAPPVDAPSLPLPLANAQLPPSKSASIEECSNYYEYIFEQEFQEILKKTPSKPIKKPRISKKDQKKQSPFDAPPPVVKAKDDMDRWLQLFEIRLKDIENSFPEK